MPKLAQFTPQSLQGYQRSWLSRDIIAGVTLAAVAIPETMGYTSIAQTPVVTGLYTVIFPTLVFALLGSSRLLVVGADSATAAILAAGLAGVGIAGLQPNSTEWLAWTSLVALVCGGLLVVARLLKLGFLGDFLSASVLVGFLTGVGIQVFAGQIPDMLGIPKGSGNWFEQQWWMITHLGAANLWTVAFAVGALPSPAGELVHVNKKLANPDGGGTRCWQEVTAGYAFIHNASTTTPNCLLRILTMRRKTQRVLAPREAFFASWDRVKRVLTDNGSCYRSLASRTLGRSCTNGPAVSSQTNGKVERFNRTCSRWPTQSTTGHVWPSSWGSSDSSPGSPAPSSR